ncbi:MAG: 4Fe-4S dicluster domain-containing protein [Candidatus Helarchaeota archaeon]|nr:4Fe-4S dicluster domain-containing protein [Candidatus Helarchaeota archaeon]
MSLTISSEFRKELSKLGEGFSVNYCYQCGTCSGGCPALRYTKIYNPRRIMENVLLGFKESTLDDPVLWLCTMCHACLEACPQGVKVSEILVLLRNLATQRGKFPEHLNAEVSALMEYGLINPGSSAIQRRRQQLNLPEVPRPIVANIKKVAEASGFIKLTGYKPKEE